MKAFLPLLVATLLAGCVTEPPLQPSRVTYLCDRGPPVTVVYAGDTATIVGDDGGIVLQRKSSGSVIAYESATRSIRGKGGDIMYTVGRMAPMMCSAELDSPAPQH